MPNPIPALQAAIRRARKRDEMLQTAFDAGCNAFPAGQCASPQKYMQAEWQRGFVHQARVEAWRRSNAENEAAANWHETRPA